MSEKPSTPPTPTRLETLLSYLEQDAENLHLLVDAAEAALVEGHGDVAQSLITKHSEIAPLEQGALDRLGQSALASKQFALAVQLYDIAFQAHSDDPSLRFNLAYAHSMQKAFEPALDLLDAATTAALPQAAMLEVQLLHDQGEFELALEKGREHLQLHSTHEGLNAALSVLAMDVEDEVMALATAQAAGVHPDALTTLGTLALGDDSTEAAMALFEHALSINPHGPRTWVGRGLAKLSAGDNVGAAADLDQGAGLFEDHIGSWIAAGWAYFVAGDMQTSRVRFEHAYDIDHNFAESIGALAVLDAVEGDTKQANRRAKTALRLDRECFSATLAKTLLLSADGKEGAAKALFDQAITTPIGKEGRTIAQALARGSLPNKR